MRVRVALGEGAWLAAGAGNRPVKFWWEPSEHATTVQELLAEVAASLRLKGVHPEQLTAELEGYALLAGSAVSLLREGDLLVVNANPRKRKAAAGGAATGAAASPAAGAATKRQKLQAAVPSSSEEESSSSDEEEEESSSEEATSSSSEEEDEEGSLGKATSSDPESSSKDEEEVGVTSSSGSEEESDEEVQPGKERFYTPGDKLASPPEERTPVGQASTDKRPSRSARRKAAKRRLRRMGVLPPKPAAKVKAKAGGQQRSAAKAAEGQLQQQQQQQQRQQQQHRQQQLQQLPGNIGLEIAAAADPLNPNADSQQQELHQPAAAAALPEVSIPEGWVPAPRQHLHARRQEQPALPAAETRAAAAPSTPMPALAEAAFAELPVAEGLPEAGDVLAYKLLEIGANFAPQVSEPRLGRVAATDAATGAITLLPHPHPAAHPLAYQRALLRQQRLAEADAAGGLVDEEEEEEEDELPRQYEDDGSLTVELSSFVELRLAQGTAQSLHKGRAAAPPKTGVQLQAAMPQHAAGVAAAAAGGLAAEGQEEEALGPKSWSRLGPPRPPAAAAKGHVIPPEGGWASLYQQLQQRRQQLEQQHPDTAGGTPAAAARHTPAGAERGSKSAPPAARRGDGAAGQHAAAAQPRSLTPGATRPRPGVRQSALGPMLRMLRENSEFQD